MGKKVVFKKYVQNQGMLFPPSYEEMIPENHAVRVVNDIVERIDISRLEKTYKGGGASSYHPRMLLKVVIYAYLRNIYSSRKIEAALEENVHFIWLAGGAKPDHNTINDFRGKRLAFEVKAIFSQVVMVLAEEGVLGLKELTVDGTKLEANANRYSFVWGKSIKNHRERIAKQLKELMAYVENVYRDEESQPRTTEVSEISPEAVARAIKEINEALDGKRVDPKIREKLRKGKKNWPKKLAEYDEHERKLGGRGSYSKTDPDATFMRMKEDHKQNSQPKPGYNLQASTSEQYLVGYTVGQSPADNTLLEAHLESHAENYGEMPETVTADAGYGTTENYEYLEEKGIVGYLKYNTFDKEQKSKKYQSNIFNSDNFKYDEKQDLYYCPTGQEMRFVREGQREGTNGKIQELRYYQAENCEGCPVRDQCHKGSGERTIQRNLKKIHYREKARERLLGEEGVKKLKERWKVESVFGNIKKNHGFRRFLMRGLEKVSIEIGLVALAHNLRKYAGSGQKRRKVEHPRINWRFIHYSWSSLYSAQLASISQ